MPKIIDAHTHLESQFFGDYRNEALKRALDNEIFIINVGVDKKSSQEAIEIANQNSFGVWATVGQHPTENNSPAGEFDYDFYKKLALEEKVVAIGECGLDYYRIKNDEDKKAQKGIFIQHIKLANEVNKPLMIHCRSAFDDLIEILKPNTQNLKPSILHFFTGTLENAKQLLEMGFYFTFGGLITFNRSFDEIIKFLPLDKILLETDAPFVAPIPYRGQKNEPFYIIEIAKKMAEIKGVSFKDICDQTTENVRVVFRLKI